MASPDSISPVLLEFLSWVAARPRTHSETMAAWRSTCPRQSVWEDALIGGLVRVENGRTLDESAVLLTPDGQAVLDRYGVRRLDAALGWEKGGDPNV